MPKNENEETVESKKEEAPQIIMLGGSDSELRTISLYGDVTEDTKTLHTWYLKETAKTEELEDPMNPESPTKEVIRPAEFIISNKRWKR